MGKIAVPEHILNKPGTLTPAEFERMKLHASIGADILSAIDFPYPVVPMVRHHHEAWNGTGYPDGIGGTEIPIGARILAVVDCFDALTSDRPYRKKLSNEEALMILWQRRGSMYDPIVVDAFATACDRLEQAVAEEVDDTHAPFLSVRRNTTTDSNDIGRHQDATTHCVSGAVYKRVYTQVLSNIKSLVEVASVIVYFEYDETNDELVALQVVSDRPEQLLGYRIAVGERLSGWVAANRRAITNSGATIDLGCLAQTISGIELKCCMSSPVMSKDRLHGVLTLYSTEADAFSDEHLRIVEVSTLELVKEIEVKKIAKDRISA